MENENEDALSGLRDALRSARRWQELLTEHDRQALLADIARIGLAVAQDLAGSAQDLDIGESPTLVAACPVERLAFLQSIVPRVLAAVSRLEKEPPVALRSMERDTPMERAHRVSPSALRSLVRKPLSLHVGRQYRAQETVFTPTQDTPPIRAAKTIVATFTRDLSTIAALALAAERTEVAAHAERSRVPLQRTLRRSFWRDVPTLPRVPPLAPTLRNNGAHRLLHDLYRRYRQGFAWDWSHPLFRLPARETWLLYEYWCLFAVIASLRQLGFRTTAEEGFLRVRSDGIILLLATDNAARLTLRRGTETVIVTYQKRFARGEPGSTGLHSRAQTLIPDITVEHKKALLILDAKFKTYAERGTGREPGKYLSALDDMRQLHSYRDAIRWEEQNPVRAAWALYAGRVRAANRAVIAFPESSSARPFGNGEVGALLLRPEDGGLDYLTARLKDFLSG